MQLGGGHWCVWSAAISFEAPGPTCPPRRKHASVQYCITCGVGPSVAQVPRLGQSPSVQLFFPKSPGTLYTDAEGESEECLVASNWKVCETGLLDGNRVKQIIYRNGCCMSDPHSRLLQVG